MSVGSSPLTRGKHLSAMFDRSAGGLIPAHAGKTRGGAVRARRGRAHPRSRGENAGELGAGIVGAGSSPLTRGKQGLGPVANQPVGLIPAHAGKTLPRALLHRATKAHPRSRGENSAPASAWLIAAGSSPLTRGKLRRDRCPVLRHGLIPAHAGKTTTSTRSPKTSRAHPRSRGENIRPRLVVWENVGSSPLTRGKLVRGGACLSACGLIPAHAGKTGLPGGVSKNTGAHPRSRGENAELARALRNLAGSSPLTRGKRNQELIKATGAGLIPAHAGKTVSVAEVIRPMGAHPRSRGENRLIHGIFFL